MKRSNCPISYSLEIFGDKWTLLIIRDLIFTRKQNFQDFQASPEKIATNILADRLQMLEQQGIISKRHDPSNRRKFIYELTTKGIDLIPVLIAMIEWGAKYDPETGANAFFMQGLTANRQQFIEQLRSSLTPAKS